MGTNTVQPCMELGVFYLKILFFTVRIIIYNYNLSIFQIFVQILKQYSKHESEMFVQALDNYYKNHHHHYPH